MKLKWNKMRKNERKKKHKDERNIRHWVHTEIVCSIYSKQKPQSQSIMCKRKKRKRETEKKKCRLEQVYWLTMFFSPVAPFRYSSHFIWFCVHSGDWRSAFAVSFVTSVAVSFFSSAVVLFRSILFHERSMLLLRHKLQLLRVLQYNSSYLKCKAAFELVHVLILTYI